MLILYDGTTSVCAIKVRITLVEKGLDFQSRNIDLRKGEQFSSDYLQLNPNAVVPTLVDGENIVLESSIIMQYLEDLIVDNSLLPESPQSRAKMRMWLKRIDDLVHPATGIITHATAFRPSFLQKSKKEQKAHLNKIPDIARRQRQEAVYKDGLNSPIVESAIHTFEKFICDMNTVLKEHEYISGSSYTLADAAATPYINRLASLKLLGVWRERAPKVFNWYDRICSRQSFEKAVTKYLTDSDVLQFSGIDDNVAVVARRILMQK
ncbi:MAG: glutathione S-transferase family protein [Pseudomonadota bacterium]|nr:glutathione S-transferase family protein [Pseudomonadota bacterium]